MWHSPFCLTHVILDASAQTHAALLQGERHDAGIAAGGGGGGRRSEIIRHHDIGARGLGDMHVAVDAARKHQQSGGIDLGASLPRSRRRPRRCARPDAYIRAKCVGSRGNGAATNGKIQLSHCASPVDPCKAQAAVHPPSTIRLMPVTKLASSLARNNAAGATSSGSPSRGQGVRRWARSSTWGSIARPVAPVWILPGATALQTMPCAA